MMRAIGFLLGVCLTVAAVLLVLDNRESPPPRTVAQAPSASTAEEPAVQDPSPPQRKKFQRKPRRRPRRKNFQRKPRRPPQRMSWQRWRRP